MKIMKSLLLPLCLFSATSVFAGSWTDDLVITDIADYYEPYNSQPGEFKVFFKTAPTSETCQTESNFVTYLPMSINTYTPMLMEALIHHKKVQIYVSECSNGIPVMNGVKITNKLAF